MTVDDPVERAAEIDDAGGDTKQEQPAPSAALRRGDGARDDERRQRDPRNGGWPNLGKLAASSRPESRASAA